MPRTSCAETQMADDNVREMNATVDRKAETAVLMRSILARLQVTENLTPEVGLAGSAAV